MAEQDLVNAFNDCIDRLAAGQSIDECLRRYPQFATALRPMLETGQQVRAMRVSPVEVAQVQERARYRFEEAVRLTAPRRKSAYPIYRLASLAAAILLIGVVILGGAGVMAQASLPGDPLYSVKLFTEQIRQSFDSELASQFDQRRIDEVQQLISAGRIEDVTFRGEVAFVDAAHWTVASLTVTISPDTRGASVVHDGDTVEVQATTTSMGEIIANSIIVLVEKPPTPAPLPTHVPTAFPVTARPTATDTPTITPTPSPSLTSTLTAIPTVTHTPSPSSTTVPTLTIAPSATACIPTAPAGWVSYQVQPGDTLSRLAASRGITLTQLMAANCLVDPGFIVAGEVLYLPAVQQIESTPQPTSEGGDNNINLNDNSSGDSGGGSNSGSGSSNSNDNNDNGDDHGSHGSDG